MHPPFRFSGPGCFIVAFAAAAVGTIIIFLVKGCHRIKQLRELEQIHGCKKPPNEGDRFQYDFFGIVKAIELAFHFRNRTSLSYTNALFQKYGETYTSNVLGYRLLFTCNAGNIKHLLSTAFVDFDSSPLRRPLFEPITPNGIFTLDGTNWKISREKLRSQLSDLRKAIDLNLCERHFQAFCQHVPPNGQVFDIQSRVFALSLDIQTMFSLGESVDALSFTQSREKEQFLEHLLLVKERIVQDGFRGPLRHLSSKRKFLQSCRRAREYVMVRIIRNVQRQNSMDEKPGERPNMKSDISVDVDKVSQLTDQSLSVLLANDSMSTTLSGLFFCLSQNERVVRKLRASILDTIGSTPPTWGQLGRLHYVRWVLQEGANLHDIPALRVH